MFSIHVPGSSPASSIAHRERARERWILLAAMAVVGLLLPAIAGIANAQDENPGGLPYYSDMEGTAQPGGTVRFLLYEDPNTLNPIAGATSIASQVIASMMEGLTENDPDGNFVPILAAEIADAGERRRLRGSDHDHLEAKRRHRLVGRDAVHQRGRQVHLGGGPGRRERLGAGV